MLGSPLLLLNCRVAIQGTNTSTSILQQFMMAECIGVCVCVCVCVWGGGVGGKCGGRKEGHGMSSAMGTSVPLCDHGTAELTKEPPQK